MRIYFTTSGRVTVLRALTALRSPGLRKVLSCGLGFPKHVNISLQNKDFHYATWGIHVTHFSPCFINWGCGLCDGRAWLEPRKLAPRTTAFVSYYLESWVSLLSNDRAWTCAPFTVLWPQCHSESSWFYLIPFWFIYKVKSPDISSGWSGF